VDWLAIGNAVRSAGEAFCGVWIWAEEHSDEIERARRDFAGR
jgi:hypothetical protein